VSNFHEFGVDVLRDIVSHPLLQLDSEDSLAKIILSAFSDLPKVMELLEFVKFEWLSVTSLSSLVDPDVHLFEFLNISIWDRICRRLILPVSPSLDSSRQYYNPGISRCYESGAPLKGVISFLTNQCQGNVHDCGLVNITSSSCNSNHPAKNAADLTANSKFGSKN
jgi:hypothetical protein